MSAIADAFTTTFRITSRPNCKPPVECFCSQSLTGLQVDFDGYTYTIGEEVDQWDDFDTYGIYRQAFGNVNAYTINHYTTDEFNIASFSRRQIDIYCETVDGVPTWRAFFRTWCYSYDAFNVNNGTTEDQWMGGFLCYEACEDLENDRQTDDPIPLNDPVEVEYLGRETIGTACTPPARPSLTIRQIATC